ncbi:MAG: hypothetical protein DRP79_04510 [Planctomycetota bacterium]|nr:MAG: hypothetical protein DRP79_04510 [Planctomycetota bacterium]
MTWSKSITPNSRKGRQNAKCEGEKQGWRGLFSIVAFPGRWSAISLLAAIILVIYPLSVQAEENAGAAETQPAEVPAQDKNHNWFDYSLPKGGFQIYKSEDGKTRLSLGGEIFARYAYWNWFEGPSHDNKYSYGFQRTRLNLKFTSECWTVLVQPQYVHMFGVPDDAFKKPPEGPLGMGGLYYKHNDSTNPRNVGFHQAYLAFHSPGKNRWLFKVGRFEYSDGLEVLRKTDGKHFNALKKMRLGDRMISPFGWSAFGRSFDGALGQYDQEKINVTTSFFYPTQGGWEEDINETIGNIKIATFTLTAKRGSFIPGMELAAFYYNYRDDRHVTQRVDNTGKMFVPNGADINIHMFGGHVAGVYDVGPGKLDLLLWGGAQFGDWYELDQSAYAMTAEVGYQFTRVFAKPWLRVGYYVGSGDGDPSDGDHETFFQMAPGTRKYNLLPYCDLMNNEDLFVQLILHPIKNLMLRTDYHILRLNEEDDRWYMGSGPTQDNGRIFGYIGRPTHGKDNLAQEIDILVNYAVNPHISLLFSYSHIFGGNVVEEVYSEDDDADYLSIGILFKF